MNFTLIAKLNDGEQIEIKQFKLFQDKIAKLKKEHMNNFNINSNNQFNNFIDYLQPYVLQNESYVSNSGMVFINPYSAQVIESPFLIDVMSKRYTACLLEDNNGKYLVQLEYTPSGVKMLNTNQAGLKAKVYQICQILNIYNSLMVGENSYINEVPYEPELSPRIYPRNMFSTLRVYNLTVFPSQGLLEAQTQAKFDRRTLNRTIRQIISENEVTERRLRRKARLPERFNIVESKGGRRKKKNKKQRLEARLKIAKINELLQDNNRRDIEDTWKVQSDEEEKKDENTFSKED